MVGGSTHCVVRSMVSKPKVLCNEISIGYSLTRLDAPRTMSSSFTRCHGISEVNDSIIVDCAMLTQYFSCLTTYSHVASWPEGILSVAWGYPQTSLHKEAFSFALLRRHSSSILS